MKILLTPDQTCFIEDMLIAYDAELITQQMWNVFVHKFQLTKRAYSRRSVASGVNIKVGYAWEEYHWGKHPKRALVQLRCIHCGVRQVMIARKLFLRKHNVQACSKCYSRHHLYDDDWRKNNSKTQLIAQNRPEVLEKHRENTRKMWKGDMGVRMRAAHKRVVTSESYKENMARVMRKKWEDPNYRAKINGKGIYKHVGKFHNIIRYDSKLELTFLLWCEANNKNVRRCDIGIDYHDPEENKRRKYYPDFIVDEKTIVEVKGQRWIDISPHTWNAKYEALQLYCNEHAYSYRLMLDADFSREYRKKADVYHETQKQAAVPL